MRLVYFAKVREAIGMDGEEREFPATVKSIADGLDWLEAQSGNYPAAFADRDRLRFALDLQMAKLESAIGSAQELAIFPPVTGG
jgi:sulfur-carrier protein